MNEPENLSPPQQEQFKKFYRSTRQRVIAGVCGGLAEYFSVDVVIVRLAWALFALVGGAGIIAYILCWIIVPERKNAETTVSNSPKTNFGMLIIGFILVALGFIAIAGWWGIFATAFPFNFCALYAPGFFPAILILVGLGLLIGWLVAKSRTGSTSQSVPEAEPSTEHTARQPRRLYRARDFRVIAGICGGIGKYLNLDPTIVRILLVLFALSSLGMVILVYVILIFIIPEESLA